jgi:hypothetical protein
MNMTTRFQKFALLAHISLSVGWFGAIIPYLALAISGLVSRDALMVRGRLPFNGLDRLVGYCAIKFRCTFERVGTVVGHSLGLASPLVDSGEARPHDSGRGRFGSAHAGR